MNPQNPIAPPAEHAFALFIRALGKGKTGSRALTRAEAEQALAMILRGEATQAQIGAFLMLLRVKEESADELAGFVGAARAYIQAPRDIAVALDWSSYAGKRRQLPWFLLSALTLADRGLRVFMHGSGGSTAGRLYTEAALRALGIEAAQNWHAVAQALDRDQFAFMPLRNLCPPLQALIDLRREFGLRSPVHSLVRLLNPLAATHSIQSIFHPPYALRHQRAAADLGQRHASVFKGEGGEVERKPEALCTVYSVHDGVCAEEVWPKLVEGRQEQPPQLDIEQLRRVWRGAARDDYGELAVTGTLAIALRLLGRADTPARALALAGEYWQQRRRERL
jgi:anthranilate phosphoribosyltransferase